MKTTSWKQLREETRTPAQIQRVDQRVEEELAKMALQDVRKHLGLTQEQLAEIMDVSQPELSRLEHSKNPLLATVRRYIEALGGELEVTVILKNKRVRLEGM